MCSRRMMRCKGAIMQKRSTQTACSPLYTGHASPGLGYRQRGRTLRNANAETNAIAARALVHVQQCYVYSMTHGFRLFWVRGAHELRSDSPASIIYLFLVTCIVPHHPFGAQKSDLCRSIASSLAAAAAAAAAALALIAATATCDVLCALRFRCNSP